MGKKDKQKKGKGAEKTTRKTQLKLEKKVLKVEKESEEQSIEQLIAEFKKEQEKLREVIVVKSAAPSPRSHFTLTASPDTNELVLFGGEYYDGKKMTMYSDLFVFHCKNMTWDLVRSPTTPPPRSGHQAVFIKTNSIPASIWIFGGEYASPTLVRFYHYKDLWSLRVRTRKWEQVRVEGTSGPCARSGHRMLFLKNALLLFGGFCDTGRKTVYFNDMWKFDLTALQWTSVKLTGDAPSSRSACLLFSGADLKTLYIVGGYRKEMVSKELERGVACSDFYRITVEKELSEAHCSSVRPSGARPKLPRTAMAGVVHKANGAILFGGVHDVETDDGESVLGHFHNDLFVLELDKARWHNFQYATPKQDPSNTALCSEPDTNLETNQVSISHPNPGHTSQISEGVFTLSLGAADSHGTGDRINDQKGDSFKQLVPSPRSSPGLVLLGSTLYVYGGVFEVGDRKITLDDFYSLDLNQPVSWQCLYAGTQADQEWYGSDLDEDDDEDQEESEMEVDENENEDESSDDDEELVEEAPVIELGESYEKYWERSKEVWYNLVRKGLDERETGSSDTNPTLSNLAERLAKEFYQSNSGASN